MSKKKLFLITFSTLTAIILLATFLCNRAVVNSARGHLYTDSKAIPFNRVGLLLGTTKSGRNGHDNPYYTHRVQAATKLIKDGKIRYLVISGDNGRKDYNEPELMRKDLINAGIDSSVIYLDYAGFRTFDSIKRLKEIFGQDSVTIISQGFHNERAIYIATKEEVFAIGYNAADVSARQGFKTQMREKFARVKVFIDFLFGVKPKYLGSKIIIPA